MTTLDQAAAQLEAAKIAESQAVAARIDAENAVLALTGVEDEGSKTHRGAAYKVTVTGVVNRRVDEAALGAVREQVSADIFDLAFRFKPEVSVAGVKHLRNNEVELYAIVAQAITATPGKPSVRIEAIGADRLAA